MAAGAKTDILARLARLDSCALSDALDRLGLPGVVLGLQAMSVQRRVAGRAVTVQLEPAAGRSSARHLGTAAVDASGPRDVIVVANGGRLDAAGWGGILALGAAERKVEGVLVDGACRDVDECRDLGLPVYARAAVPVTARGRVIETGWNEAVSFGGVRVAAGDLVLADASGVVFLASAGAADVLTAAEEIASRERAMAEAVRAGRPLAEVMGASYEQLIHGGGN
ncbi:MAG: RraA family protein [Chloroflexota bacterium]|nr:RraA family protein [Chloroflexota bacterium]